MCKRCVPKLKEAAERLGVLEDEVASLLGEVTAYPFNSFEETWRQMDDYIEKRLAAEGSP